MKKIIGILIVIIVLFVLIVVYKNYTSKDVQDMSIEEYKTSIKDKKFMSLPTLTFDELDQKIKSKETFVVYFAWVYNCGDSRNLQSTILDDYLTDSFLKKYPIYVVNLDDEAPDALVDHDKREPITKRFLIDTWTKDEVLNPLSLKSPQFVEYSDGRIVNAVSWSTITSDSKTGISKERLDEFFNSLNKK